MVSPTSLRGQSRLQYAIKKHQCPQCWNSYSRRDHLIRHMRSHEGPGTLRCPVCGRQFRRRDLLLKHSRLHSCSGSAQFSQNVGERVLPRATTACHPCAIAKARCHDRKPCRRCRERGIECTNYPRHRCTKGHDQTPVVVTPERISEIFDEDGVQDWMDDFSSRQMEGHVNTLNDDDILDIVQRPTPDLQSPWPESEAIALDKGRQEPEYEEHGPLLLDRTLDVSFNPPGPFSLSIVGGNMKDQIGSVYGADRAHELPQSASWLPLHDEGMTRRSSPSRGQVQPPPENACPAVPRIFDQCTRDTLFALILGEQKYEEIHPNCAEFPSPTVMDVLADRFLRKQKRKLDCWIHTATFSPVTAPVEYTLMVLAAGAFGAQNSSLRQWGYQTCGLMRRRILMKLEHDWTLPMMLPYLQALLICLEIESWTSHNYGLLKGASLSDTMRNCLERYARFSQWCHESDGPQHDDVGVALQIKWAIWISSEGLRRLAGRFWTVESQRAAALHIRTSRASSDLCLSLPQPRSLWTAQTAPEWKERYLALYTARIPRVKDFLTSLTASRFSMGFIDPSFAIKISAHYVEGLIIDRQHLFKVFRNGFGGNSQQAEHWKEELNAAIQNLKHILQVWYRHSPATKALANLTVSYLSMILNVCVEDFELLFQIDRDGDSQVIYQDLQKWADTREARETIWQAGQILRELRYIERPLSGFIVIMAYQAGLVLLGYLYLKNQIGCMADGGAIEHVVVLNGSDPSTIRSFVQTGVGKLALQHNFEAAHRTISPMTFQRIVQVVTETLHDETIDIGQNPQALAEGHVRLLEAIANGRTHDGAYPKRIEVFS